MMRFGLVRGSCMFTLLGFLAIAMLPVSGHAQAAAASPDSAFSIPMAQLIQPAELNRLLAAHGGERPLVLQVGSRMLFDEAHIPGSEYTGPGSQEAGRTMIQNRVAALPHSSFIVLYCGCCPWERCPNMGPAFKRLHDLGFTRVKALYLAQNFGTDWVEKGYAVERGH